MLKRLARRRRALGIRHAWHQALAPNIDQRWPQLGGYCRNGQDSPHAYGHEARPHLPHRRGGSPLAARWSHHREHWLVQSAYGALYDQCGPGSCEALAPGWRPAHRVGPLAPTAQWYTAAARAEVRNRGGTKDKDDKDDKDDKGEVKVGSW